MYGAARPPTRLRRADWYRRFQAWLLSHEHASYIRSVDPYKRELLSELAGTVVEIGPGAGVNLPYYRETVRWIGVEPNPFLHEHIRARAAELGREIELTEGTAESLPFQDDAVDAVVSTLVLCSVTDARRTVGEILRVLRRGGRFVFIEHVADPHGGVRARVQRGIRPLWSTLADGCHPDRRTWETIERAGFKGVELEHFTVPVPVVATHIAGVATK